MSIIADMTREEKATVFVVCVVEGLIDKGLVVGHKRATDKARSAYSEMLEEGFQPTDDEVGSVMKALMAEGES